MDKNDQDGSVSAAPKALPWMSRLVKACNPLRQASLALLRANLRDAIFESHPQRYEMIAAKLMRDADEMGERGRWAGGKAMRMAMVHWREEFLKDLLDKGADPNIAFESKTPLMRATEANWVAAVILLTTAGADTERCDERGRTPLRRAAGRQELTVARALIEAGARVDALDSAQSTPLAACVAHKMDSAMNGSGESGENARECVRLLLSSGADPSKGVVKTYSPLALACSRGDQEMVQMLLNAGADPAGIHAGGFAKTFKAFSNSPPMIALVKEIEALAVACQEAAELVEVADMSVAKRGKGPTRM